MRLHDLDINDDLNDINNLLDQPENQQITPNVKIIREKVTDYKYPEELSEPK